jgi:glycosyltransferase involved in cell wall biosynthesis
MQMDRSEAPSHRPKLLYLVTEDWHFCSHRLLLARAAKAANFDVVVATRVKDHGAQICAEGFKLVPIHLSRRSTNPLQELESMWELLRVYQDEKPDIVHQVSVKPVLYGSVVGRLSGVGGTVNALTGLGYVFSSPRLKARLLRPFVVAAYRLALNRRASRLILQNPDDEALLRALGAVHNATRLSIIRGSGVDLNAYPTRPEPGGVPLVVLPSRMIWDKGVGDFVEAARSLRARGISARFALVGDSDPDNPAAISESQLRTWHEEGAVEWWGYRKDMAEVLAGASVVCLPSSYGEGIPKALIEAASCARPIVTTDVPGCREIVRQDDNGLLVPPHDVPALAHALERLLGDATMRARMGARGRERVADEFCTELVIEATLALYRELLRR